MIVQDLTPRLVTEWPRSAYSNPNMKEEPGLRISPDARGPVVCAVKNEHFYPQWSRLIAKAQTLGKRYRLDLPWVVKNMHAEDRWFMETSHVSPGLSTGLI